MYSSQSSINSADRDYNIKNIYCIPYRLNDRRKQILTIYTNFSIYHFYLFLLKIVVSSSITSNHTRLLHFTITQSHIQILKSRVLLFYIIIFISFCKYFNYLQFYITLLQKDFRR